MSFSVVSKLYGLSISGKIGIGLDGGNVGKGVNPFHLGLGGSTRAQF
jgi:hypothetical protein